MCRILSPGLGMGNVFEVSSKGVHLGALFISFLVSFNSNALFDLMMALQSTETHNITLKNQALFRPKFRDSNSTNQIARFVNYYCYGVNVRVDISIRLKNRRLR